MLAVVQSGFGPAADVLAVAEVEKPSVAPNEVLIRVRAAGVTRGSWLITHGLPYIARPSYGIRKPKNPVAGLEFAGTIEAAGADVHGFGPGDEVFGSHTGAFAELIAVPATEIARKPATVSFEQAAAASVSGCAALQAVREANVKPGTHVLVLGASGGVGSFVVQIAKAFGAVVTGVASTRNLELVRELGADHVIDYTSGSISAPGDRYDVIIDIAGNRPVRRMRKLLAPTGTLVIVGGTGSRLTMGFERTVGAMLISALVKQRIVGLLSTPNQKDLEEIAELMGSGQLSPVVRQRFPLERAAEAIEKLASGHGQGSMVVAI